MKNLALVLIGLSILISSCGESDEEVVCILPEVSEGLENTTQDTTENHAAPIDAVQENPLTIENFPHTWYMLNPKEEGGEELVINRWCEAETQQLWIRNEDGEWYLHILYGQDGSRHKILEFEAYEEERELYQVMYGTITIENTDLPEIDAELYDFVWNKDLKFCHFDGFFANGSMMVSEQNKDNYELIEENCDYLNDM